MRISRRRSRWHGRLGWVSTGLLLFPASPQLQTHTPKPSRHLKKVKRCCGSLVSRIAICCSIATLLTLALSGAIGTMRGVMLMHWKSTCERNPFHGRVWLLHAPAHSLWQALAHIATRSYWSCNGSGRRRGASVSVPLFPRLTEPSRRYRTADGIDGAPSTQKLAAVQAFSLMAT